MSGCEVYIQGGGAPLAGGGRHHRHCKRKATQTRTIIERSVAWEREREVHLCGHHAAQHDRSLTGADYPLTLRSDA